MLVSMFFFLFSSCPLVFCNWNEDILVEKNFLNLLLTASVSYFYSFKTKSKMTGNCNYTYKTDCTKYPLSGCYSVVQLKTFVVLAASLHPAYGIGSIVSYYTCIIMFRHHIIPVKYSNKTSESLPSVCNSYSTRFRFCDDRITKGGVFISPLIAKC